MNTKPVCKEGEETQEIKLKEDTNMGNAGVEGFKPGFPLGQTKHRYKYLNVGECDEDYVKAKYTESHKQTIDLVNLNIFCCQLHDGHVLTIRMGSHSGSVIFQLVIDEDETWNHKEGCSECHSNTNLCEKLVSKNACMSQRITDCHIAVQGHGQQNT